MSDQRAQYEAPVVKQVTVEVLQRLLDAHMAFYVDWARLNSYSPDYDPAYKPEYPPIVREATEALTALRRVAE